MADISVSLQLQNQQFNTGIDQSSQKIDNLEKNAKKSLDNIGDAFQTMGKLATGALTAIAYSALKYADDMGDMAAATGLTTAQIMEFTNAVALSGGSADAAGKGIQSFYAKLDAAKEGSKSAQESFLRLHGNLQSLYGLTDKQIFYKTIEELGKMKPGAEQAALSADLLGKTFKGLSPEAVAEKLKELNGKYDESSKSVEKLADFNDQLSNTYLQLQIAFAETFGDSIKALGEWLKNTNDVKDAFKALVTTVEVFIALNLAANIAKCAVALKEFYTVFSAGTAVVAATTATLATMVGWLKEILVIAASPIVIGIYAMIRTDDIGETQKELDDLRKENEAEYQRVKKTREYLANSANKALGLKGSNKGKEGVDESGKPWADPAANAKASKAKQVADAYNQQLLSLKQQTEEVGKQQTIASKLAIEFEKGGQFETLKGTQLEKNMMLAAKNLDNIKASHEGEQAITDILEKHKELKQAAVEAGREAYLNVLDMRSAERESFKNSMDELKRADERLQIEESLAGQSAEVVRHKLAEFDIETKILAMKKDPASERFAAEYEKTATAIEKRKQAHAAEQETFAYGWEQAWKRYSQGATEAQKAGQMFDSVMQNMNSALDNFVETGKFSFSDFARSIIADLVKIEMKAAAMQIFGGGNSSGGGIMDLFGGSSSGGGGIMDLFSSLPGLTSSSTDFANGGGIVGAISGLFGFAKGGTPPVDKASMVGENGPELFVPNSAGTILPNGKGLGGDQTNTVIYNTNNSYNISAVDGASVAKLFGDNRQMLYSQVARAQKEMG